MNATGTESHTIVLLGNPNTGKTTLFNALTQAGIDAQNFPFCTIEPNTGIVPVPDPRLTALADIVGPEKAEKMYFEEMLKTPVVKNVENG